MILAEMKLGMSSYSGVRSLGYVPLSLDCINRDKTRESAAYQPADSCRSSKNTWRRERDMFCITAKLGTVKGRSWPIGGRPLVIGRGNDCDIRILDPIVSRRHCEIFVTDEHLQLQDLGSRNQVLLNGIPVDNSRLELGDEIRVGGTVFFVTKAENTETQQALERCSTITLTEGESTLLSSSVRSDPAATPLSSYKDLSSLFSISMRLSCASSREELNTLLRRALIARFKPSNAWLLLLRNNQEEICCLHGSSELKPPRELMLMTLANRTGALFPQELGASKGFPAWTLAAPLCLADLKIGALAVMHDGNSRYDRDDLDFLVALACIVSPCFKALERIEELKSENVRLRASENDLSEMVGNSDAIARIKTVIRAASASTQNVLITGETGTGKELVSHLIHSLSDRRNEKLVTVNCAAIPRELFESELFGYEKGAFTGAGTRKSGLMEESDGGTLFLDEIGDLSLENQSKILRAVDGKSFRRVGGSSEICSDFRLLAATNKDLPSEIKMRRFREDLYHRLNVLHIQLPPLRERRTDIPELAQHFLDLRMKAENRKLHFTPEAIEYLMKREWPGNVRELKNSIERAIALSQNGLVEIGDLHAVSYSLIEENSPDLTLQEAEQIYIAKALKASNNNVVEAAKRLGIGKSTLYNKLRQYHLL